jgi:hypothetical protein
VGVAVNLDDKLSRAGDEVGDIGIDNNLVIELHRFEAFGAEVVPEAGFSGRGVAAHVLGAR